MVATVVAMLAGVWAIGAYAGELQQLSSAQAEYGDAVYMGLCILVLAGCLLVAWMFNRLAERVLKIVLLNWVNKGIGALVGMITAMVFTAFIAYTGQRIPVKEPLIGQQQRQYSRLLGPLAMAGSFLPGLESVEKWAGAIPPLPLYPAK